MSTDDCFCSPSTDCPTLSRELGLYLKEITTWEYVTLPNQYPYNDPTRYDRSVPYRLFKDIGSNESPELYLEGSGDIIETPFNRRSIFNKFKMWMRINPYTLYELEGEAELDGFAYFGTFEIMGDSFDVQFSYINGPAGLTRPDEVVTKYPYPHKLYGYSSNTVFEVPLAELKNPNNTTDPTMVKNGIFNGSTSYPMSFTYFSPKGFRDLPFDYTVNVQVNGLIKQTPSFYRQPVAVGIPAGLHPVNPTGILYAERDNFNRDWYIKMRNPVTQEAPFDAFVGKTYAEEKLGALPYYNNTNMPLLNQTHSNTDLGQARTAVPKAFYKNPIWELSFDKFEIEVDVFNCTFESKYEIVPELNSSLYFPVMTLKNTTISTFKNDFSGTHLLYADVTENNHIRDFLKHSFISENTDTYASDFNYARLSYQRLNYSLGTGNRFPVSGLPPNDSPHEGIVADYGATLKANIVTIVFEGGCVSGTTTLTRVVENGTHCKFFSYTLAKDLAPHLKGEDYDIPLSNGIPIGINQIGERVGGIAPWSRRQTETRVGACRNVPFPSNYRNNPRVYRYNGKVFIDYIGAGLPQDLADLMAGTPLVKPPKIEGIKIRWTGDWQ